MPRCNHCGTDNPERARFCMSCGSGFDAHCPSCGAEAPAGAGFCIECGTALPQAPAATSTPPAAGDGGHEEERRLATVLFADLSGYTAVAERMDPEAVKSMVEASLQRLAHEVHAHGGHVDKYIGDNVMAIFGAPVAHEDDPERAVRAGLAMQAAMSEINDAVRRRAGVEFNLRVGINSGEVLAGLLEGSYTVIGDAVNVASRLQTAARPGTVTVGATTWRQTRESIEYSEPLELVLKGKSEPVIAYEAITLSPTGAERPGRATRLVGRAEERAQMLAAFEGAAAERKPHLLTLLGPAGVGKSRLTRELIADLQSRPTPPVLYSGSCPSYGAGTAYWALAEILRQRFGIAVGKESGGAWAKLRDGITELIEASDIDEPAVRLAAALAAPLGIEVPAAEGISASEVAGEEASRQARDRLFSAARSVIEAAAASRPLVLVIDDIQWADEGMLDLIQHLARWVRGPLLILCLARDELLERRSGWGGGRINATVIGLEPLGESDAAELVAELLTDSAPELADLAGTIAARSAGNPLFAEEMVKRLAEEGGTDADALPDSVQAVLGARLDSLGQAEQRVLHHAAVVGETFWESSLQRFAEAERIDLGASLQALREKDLIAPSGGHRPTGEAEHAFKHALIREVAYARLPKAVRARKHIEVGEFIGERAGDRRDAVIALVAGHYARAVSLGAEAGIGDAELDTARAAALEALEAAGSQAAGLHSNQEALDHFDGALSLGDPDPARAAGIGERKGDMALRLGRADLAIETWEACLAHHRREENLERAGELHRKIGSALWQKGDRSGAISQYQAGIDMLKDGAPSLELVRLYEEAASIYTESGDNMLAIYAAEKALRLAERLDAVAAASRAQGIFGRVFGRIGNQAKAREHLERSVELARNHDETGAINALLALGSHLELFSSDPAEARGAYFEALAIAERIGDVPAQVELHGALARLALRRCDLVEADSSSRAAGRLAEREGLTGLLSFPLLTQGWLEWWAGEGDTALATLERARELGESGGRMEVAFPALLLSGWALALRGEYGAAETTIARAIDVCERAGLVSQSIEGTAARAVILARGGHPDRAREFAAEARSLAGTLDFEPGAAAALEAEGASDPDPIAGGALLADARDAWLAVSRPAEGWRAEMLRGWRLAEAGSEDAAQAFEAAGSNFEELRLVPLIDAVGKLAATGQSAQ